MKAGRLFTFLILSLGMTLVIRWALRDDSAPAVAAPRAEGHIEGPGVPIAELHVCFGGCLYSSIQDAVDAANDGDVIKVAAGTYIDVNNRGGLVQVVYISKTVTVRGGYATDNWTTSDLEHNPTTLDARGQGRVLYITGDISPAVESIRITGGNATGLGSIPLGIDAGGGAYVISATPTISNVRVFSNTADYGGGLFLLESAAALSSNSVVTNVANVDAGGVYLYSSDAVLKENTVIANTAGNNGGGLFLNYSNGTLSGNVLVSNTALDNGGGLFLREGAPTFTGNTFDSNRAAGHDGGGLYLRFSDAAFVGNTFAANAAADDGGGLFLREGAPTLEENTITGNRANNGGGGVCTYWSNASLGGNTITSNTARYGGGLHLGNSVNTVTNNIVISNAAEYGGGLNLYAADAILTNNVVADNQVSNLGSGLYIQDSRPRLLHTTIARNTGGDDSGVYVTDWSGNYSTVALTNTILVGHAVGIYVASGSTATLEATMWGSGEWANSADQGGDGAISMGTVNVQGEPSFVNPDTGNYHITPESAAIDAGVDTGVTEDIDGDPRTDGFPDIGADELMGGLIVTKRAYPDVVQPGEQLTYTIRVTNTSDMDLHATITDTLPDHVATGETAGGTTVLPGGRLVWTPVITAFRGVWGRTVLVTVEEGYAGPLTNVVEVTTKEGATGADQCIVTAEEAITGLNAVNDSPTLLGQATTLTATVATGSNVLYVWAFGDGATDGGAVVSHIYPSGGTYSAIVAVSNDVSMLTTTTTVIVPVTYLPLVLKRWPPIPYVTTLNSIDNGDQDNRYTVAWQEAELATTYILEEATSASFSDAQAVYQGANLSWIVPSPGKTPATYYYRVKARNSWGDSVWSNVRQVVIRPLFVGLQMRWDGDGFIRGSEYYDVGWHITRELNGLTDADTIRVHSHSWYDPNPLDFDSETWDSYYSVSTGHFKSSSVPRDPSWKWGYYWILPYDWQFSNGQIFWLDGQAFMVSGPHSGYTAFGQLVQYWQLVNRDKFLFWDGGGDWTQYVHPGDIALRYDAGNARLLLHSSILRRDYYRGRLTNDTVQYITNLTSASVFPGARFVSEQLESFRTLAIQAGQPTDQIGTIPQSSSVAWEALSLQY